MYILKFFDIQIKTKHIPYSLNFSNLAGELIYVFFKMC